MHLQPAMTLDDAVRVYDLAMARSARAPRPIRRLGVAVEMDASGRVPVVRILGDVDLRQLASAGRQVMEVGMSDPGGALVLDLRLARQPAYEAAQAIERRG